VGFLANDSVTQQRSLNILVISLDSPFPDDYGGTKDIWARTNLLFQTGWSVDLVASYLDPRRKQVFLESGKAALFGHVFLFPRLSLVRGFLSSKPYDLVSRRLRNQDIEKLAATIGAKLYDIVIVEGFHSMDTFESLRTHLSYKKSVLRVLNIESEYYRHLCESEPNWVKACYYRIESSKYDFFCRRYKFDRAYDAIFHISASELNHPIFDGIEQQYFIPPFLDLKIQKPEFNGRRKTFLYVGNLNLPDNRLAVRQSYAYLTQLMSETGTGYRICGKSDHRLPFRELERDRRVTFRLNITDEDLMQEYSSAKIFVNFSANRSGVKLKLLDALSHGLPVISNGNGCEGSGLEELVINVDHEPPQAVRHKIDRLLTDGQAWLEQSGRAIDGFTQFLSHYKRNYVDMIERLAS
jgi:glycosyltransferase involved in cell wall biosynthesis